MVKHDIPQPNNFNIIRLLLAVLVFLSHFFSLAGQHNGVMIIDAPDMVRGFFVISGFLIYSSYCRSNTLKSYFIKRARRILPSYIFVVLLCAFGLVFVSTLPASEYFGTDWLKYLFANLTFANFAHPTLPGVFADNYHTAVNGSLWSIKVEIMVYLALPLLVYMCKKLKANHNVFFIIVILLSIVYTFICDTMYSNTGEGKYLIYARQIGGQLAYFVFGMMLYELLDLILKHKIKIFSIGVGAIVVAYLIPEIAFLIKPMALGFIIIPAVFMGRWGQWLKSVDISYELYLAHFPIIQIIVSCGIVNSIGFFPSLLLALIASVVISLFCWHLVGKRFLRRSNRVEIKDSTGQK